MVAGRGAVQRLLLPAGSREINRRFVDCTHNAGSKRSRLHLAPRMRLHFSAPLGVAVGTLMLAGCVPWIRSDHATSRPAVRATTSKVHAARVHRPHSWISKQPRKPVAVPFRTGAIIPQNAFMQDLEIVGGSRAYTGAQVTLKNCAEQCRPDQGCDAFSFNKETKICYLITQPTGSTSNHLFVSGRPRSR